jgi:hypothetical protein
LRLWTWSRFLRLSLQLAERFLGNSKFVHNGSSSGFITCRTVKSELASGGLARFVQQEHSPYLVWRSLQIHPAATRQEPPPDKRGSGQDLTRTYSSSTVVVVVPSRLTVVRRITRLCA